MTNGTSSLGVVHKLSLVRVIIHMHIPIRIPIHITIIIYIPSSYQSTCPSRCPSWGGEVMLAYVSWSTYSFYWNWNSSRVRCHRTEEPCAHDRKKSIWWCLQTRNFLWNFVWVTMSSVFERIILNPNLVNQPSPQKNGPTWETHNKGREQRATILLLRRITPDQILQYFRIGIGLWNLISSFNRNWNWGVC